MSDADKYAPFGPFCLNENGIKKKIIDFLGGFITINRNHREVHEGEFFSCGHTFLAVANSATVYFRFLTGAKQFHYGFSIDAEGKAFARIYRGTTYTDDGTTVDIFNNSDFSSNVALHTSFHTPTIDVIGTEITPTNGILVPGGIGPQSVGGSIKGSEERIACVGTDYLIAVTNDSGFAKDITIQVAGYESGTVLT